VSRISEIANTVATGKRCYMDKDSTTPRKDHSINVMLPRAATQEAALRECARPRPTIPERLETRRQEMEQQRSLTLQAVDRLTITLNLVHPDRERSDIAHLHPDPETEATAMLVDAASVLGNTTS
jgi:hypothetical protein